MTDTRDLGHVCYRWGRNWIIRKNIYKKIFQHNLPFPWGLGTNLTVSGEKLVMKDVTRSYSGDYVCNADNGVGRWPVRQMVSLDVLCEYFQSCTKS